MIRADSRPLLRYFLRRNRDAPLKPAKAGVVVGQAFQPAGERNFPVPWFGVVDGGALLCEGLAVGKPPQPAGSKACPTRK